MLAAPGDIVVMIDVDLEVADGWLDTLLLPFERNDVMAVCGDVRPRDSGTGGIDHVEPEGKTSGQREGCWADPMFVWRPFQAWELGSVSNAAFRVAICHHPDVGPLDETLDGDDGSELLYRIVRAGYTVVREPAAVVWRPGDDQGVTPTESWSRQLRYHVTTLRRWHDVPGRVRHRTGRDRSGPGVHRIGGPYVAVSGRAARAQIQGLTRSMRHRRSGTRSSRRRALVGTSSRAQRGREGAGRVRRIVHVRFSPDPG